jgi:tetratricopeptide (TPR) repeat protein
MSMRAPLLALSLTWALVMPAVPASARVLPQTNASASDGPGYYYLLGKHLEGEGKIEQAVAAHKRAIELDPSSAELRAELAGLYVRQNDVRQAYVRSEEALARDPNNDEANRILGMIYASLAEQKARLNPGDDPATYTAKAIAALEKAKGDNSDLGLNLLLGRLYVQAREFEKAIPLLAAVTDRAPDLVDAAMLLSTAQEEAGRGADAITTIEGLLKENPQSFRAELRLAELFEQEQRFNEAADAYGKAQAMNGARAAAITPRRAISLLSAGRPAEAKALVQGALRANDKSAVDPILLYLLAESQRALKDYDGAAETARKLMTAYPDDSRGLHVLSLVLQDRGDMKGAERALRDLIARDPIDANALNSLGYMLAENGRQLDEAVTLLERALKIDPGNPSYLDSLGWAYFQQGRLDLADPHLTEAAGKLKTNSAVLDHLGDLRFKQERYRDAAAAWEQALAGDGQAIDRGKIEKKIRDARGRM